MIKPAKFAALAVALVAVAGCIEFPDEPGTAAPGAAVAPPPAMPRFSAALVDLAGRRWQPSVTDHYISATGKECVRLDLRSLDPARTAAGVAYQIACRTDDVWVLARDFAAGGKTEGDLAFAPMADAELTRF